MDVNPLFVPSVESLKDSLRLGGVPLGSNAHRIIEEAILAVRIKFYESLGPTRIDEILATPLSYSPTESEQVVRLTAYKAELCGVECELLSTLPVQFVDGTDRGDQAWNEEAMFRDFTSYDIRERMDRCMLKFLQYLDELKAPSEDNLRNDGVSVEILGSDDPIPPFLNLVSWR